MDFPADSSLVSSHQLLPSTGPQDGTAWEAKSWKRKLLQNLSLIGMVL